LQSGEHLDGAYGIAAGKLPRVSNLMPVEARP
jgi:hypothetical protein